MSKKQIVRKHEREHLQKQSRLQRKKDKVRTTEPKKTNRENLESRKNKPGLRGASVGEADGALHARRCALSSPYIAGLRNRPSDLLLGACPFRAYVSPE